MTGRCLRAAWAVLALLTAAGAVADPTGGPAAADLARTHAERFAAMVAGDLEALGPMLADELTYSHSDGRLETREQFLASLAGGELRYLEIASEGESPIRRYGGGEVGVITGAARFRVRLGERELEAVLRYTSVYVLRDGRWQLAAWHSSSAGR